MNILKAMQESMQLARDKGFESNKYLSFGMPHLEGMLEMLEKADPFEFDNDKANRWLGWMQACIIMNSAGRITLEDIKEINIKNK